MDQPSHANTELVDPGALARIRELAELDPSLPSEVIELFTSSTEEDLVGLAIAMESGDVAGVERSAHRMCSSALGAGATALGARCRALCEHARNGQLAAPDSAADLRVMRDAFVVHLRAALGL